MIYVNEGQQADEYKARKAKEKEKREKEYNEKIDRRARTAGDRNRGRCDDERYSTKSDNERYEKAGDMLWGEIDRRSQNKSNNKHSFENYTNAMSTFSAPDAINRHIRRHPKQYDKKYNESYGIFESVEMI